MIPFFIMGAVTNFVQEPCVCDFVQGLGSFKGVLDGLLTAAIAGLTTIKASILLFPNDLSDQAEMVYLEAQIKVVETVVAPIDPPFALLKGYIQPYADCDPVATLNKTLSEYRKLATGWAKKIIEDTRRKQEALDLSGSKVARLDLLINQLKDFKSALDSCNQQ